MTTLKIYNKNIYTYSKTERQMEVYQKSAKCNNKLFLPGVFKGRLKFLRLF